MDFRERVVQELDGVWRPLSAGQPAAGRSLSAGLTKALGCDPVCGPMAYWEYEDLARCRRTAIDALGGDEVVWDWSNRPGRTWNEIDTALLDAPGLNFEVPSSVALRPWCSHKLISSCRIPFVPVAAIVHFALSQAPSQRLDEVLDRFEIKPGLDPWELLRRVDPAIRYSAAPPGTALLAGRIVDVAARRSEDLAAVDPLKSAALESSSQVLWLIASDPELKDVPVGELAPLLPAARKGEHLRA